MVREPDWWDTVRKTFTFGTAAVTLTVGSIAFSVSGEDEGVFPWYEQYRAVYNGGEVSDFVRYEYANRLRKELSDELMVEREAEAYNVSYDERFTLKDQVNLPMEMLTAVETVHRGLTGDEEFREYIGKTMAVDLQDGLAMVDGVDDDGRKGYWSVEGSRTELGGIISREGRDISIELYEPGYMAGDNYFVPSDTMSNEDGIVFHYHASRAGPGEAPREHSRFYAGPSGMSLMPWSSGGDMLSAMQDDRPQVVFTYMGLSEDSTIEINADVYTYRDKGYVVDCGVVDTGVRPRWAGDE